MALILSATINLRAPSDTIHGYDVFSILISVAILIAYVSLICVIVPFILRKYWNIRHDERAASRYPQFMIIITDVDLTRKESLAFPLVNMLYRTVICVLLLSSIGFMKACIFHLMTLAFTCYVTACKPFDGSRKNKRQLTTAVITL